MPAWVYAREEYGGWDTRRDGPVELSYLAPFKLGGGTRRLVLPMADTGHQRGPATRGAERDEADVEGNERRGRSR
ncbi:hypothetical protein SDC9_132332 [bioreactor metagenome]|uniref:Uncharacterized protein n=1 Tax=bioreactor metagenome TaxID=1076179 RepID=A0A645D7D6_9ZZZZ